MVKVTIRKLRAGLTGASGLMLLQQADAGCAAPVDHAPVGATSSADTAFDPGTGTLTLSPYWTPNGVTHYSLASQGSIDEYVRVGESLTYQVSAYQLWTTVNPGTSFPPDPSAIRALQATFTVTFIANGDVIGRATPGIASWSGSEGWSMNATSDAFVVPATADTIETELVIVDPASGNKVDLADLDFDTINVFGAAGSTRHVLFDNDGGTLRDRVIEGGGVYQNTDFLLTYSDWRADEIVDKMNLDREIGTVQSYGRFGPVTVPIYGQIQYEITAGYSSDQQYFYNASLQPTTTSRVLPQAGRTAYEAYVYASGDVTDLQVYFHVKAWLVVDYTPYLSNGQNLTKKYNQGDRILLKDAYDNKDGKAFSNWDVPVQAAP